MRRIVTVPNGRGTSAATKHKKGVISGMFDVNVYIIDFFKLSKINLPKNKKKFFAEVQSITQKRSSSSAQ